VFKQLKVFFAFIIEVFNERNLIFDLSKKDFEMRYLGSYLGIIWAFIQPTINILILWFVFQVGFKSAPVENFPFILWLICGMIPWNFFNDSLNSATYGVTDNSYLVKKVVFKVTVLPIVKIISSLFVHVFFIGFIFIMFSIYGYGISIYNVQVIYYLIATITLVLGLSWLTSSIVVFLKDMGQIVSMVLQFGFWLTPIMWSYKIIPEKYLHFIKLNPLYYIIEGYRDTFIYHKWFWQDMKLTVYFWCVTLVFFALGSTVFRKLKPHFADVL
jgi:ABC-type polysaccharide/polyol phosphate export systems, permease component